MSRRADLELLTCPDRWEPMPPEPVPFAIADPLLYEPEELWADCMSAEVNDFLRSAFEGAK